MYLKYSETNKNPYWSAPGDDNDFSEAAPKEAYGHSSL